MSLKHQSRSAFERAAARAHSGRVRPGVGTLGGSGGGGKPNLGSKGDKTGGITQEPRLSTIQKFGKRGS